MRRKTMEQQVGRKMKEECESRKEGGGRRDKLRKTRKPRMEIIGRRNILWRNIKGGGTINPYSRNIKDGGTIFQEY